MARFLTTAHAEGPELTPYGQPCPYVLSLTVARRLEVEQLPQWLDALPNSHKLCAAICLKGLGCDDAQTSASLQSLKMRIHSCVEEPGGDANGHEGVCAFRFLLDNYERPWRNVFFLHGDVARPKHATQYHAFREFLLRDAWPAWPRTTRASMTPEICGCGVVGARHNPFGPVDFWHRTITWWLGNFISLREPHAAATAHEWAGRAECDARARRCLRSGLGAYPLHNGTMISPLGYMFNLDRKSALQRSRAWLRAQYRMNLVGVRTLPPGSSGAPRAAWLPAPGFDYAPLVWGHVNERLPFWQFGHEFEERPVPRCVWNGDHASMNCTQGHVEGTPLLNQSRAAHQLEMMRRPEAKAERPGGCNAYDSKCGSSG